MSGAAAAVDLRLAGWRTTDYFPDNLPQPHELLQRTGLLEIVNRGMRVGPLAVPTRVGGREDYHRRPAATFARPEMPQDFIPITLGEVQIQQEQVGAGQP